MKKWADGRSVVLVLHNSSPDEITTLEHLNKMSEAEVRWVLALHQDSIRRVGSDADVIDAVASTPGVVRVDGKPPMESGYLRH